jgi:hypothetical protein
MEFPRAERVTDVFLQNQWPAVSCAALAKGPDDPATVASESTYLSTPRVSMCADPSWMSSADGACWLQAAAMVEIALGPWAGHGVVSAGRTVGKVLSGASRLTVFGATIWPVVSDRGSDTAAMTS